MSLASAAPAQRPERLAFRWLVPVRQLAQQLAGGGVAHRGSLSGRREGALGRRHDALGVRKGSTVAEEGPRAAALAVGVVRSRTFWACSRARVCACIERTSRRS